MLHDADEIDAGTELEADLCIVGAGAAGITLAHSLVGSRLKVLLLEGGGLDYEPESQALYQGTNIGLPYFDLDIARLRQFGGSTNHWAGRCRPLDPRDFEVRDGVPLSGWPFGKAALEPYYREAQTICQLGEFDYTPAPFLDPGQEQLPFDAAKIVSRVWQFSPPTLFGEVYRPPLERAPNVEIVVHANVIELIANESGREVEALRFVTFAGKTLTARARVFVLAAGGLENPRLLLASNRQIKPGIGNQHDMVGRCFMEHLHCNAARAVVRDPDRFGFHTWGIGGGSTQGLEVLGCLNLSPTWQAEHHLLNFDGLFTADDVGGSGYAALRRIWNAAERGGWPEDLSGDLWQALINIGDTTAGLMGRFGVREYRPDTTGLRMWCTTEQAPNRDSRVRLGPEADPLGMPRIELDWRLTELDKRTLRAGHQVLAEELGRSELGRLQIESWLLDDDTAWSAEVEGGHHHMGTTRMSTDPTRGVVDANARVHGVANLYVGGSSVFPTGGSANPTLTIVALALRLGETLKAHLAS